MSKRTGWMVVMAAAAALVLGISPTVAQAQGGQGMVRAFHNSPDTPAVDIYVNGERVWSDVAYGDLSDYRELPQGIYSVAVKVAPSDSDSPAALSAEVKLGRHPLTIAAIGSLTGDGGGLRVKVLQDARGAASRLALLRVAHTSPDAPNVDVQLRLGKWWLPVIRNLAFGRATGYLPLPASWRGEPIAYDFRVVVAGTNQVLLDLPNTTLPGGNAVTVWAVGFVSPSGNANGFGPFVSVDGR